MNTDAKWAESRLFISLKLLILSAGQVYTSKIQKRDTIHFLSEQQQPPNGKCKGSVILWKCKWNLYPSIFMFVVVSVTATNSAFPCVVVALVGTAIRLCLYYGCLFLNFHVCFSCSIHNIYNQTNGELFSVGFAVDCLVSLLLAYLWHIVFVRNSDLSLFLSFLGTHVWLSI